MTISASIGILLNPNERISMYMSWSLTFMI